MQIRSPAGENASRPWDGHGNRVGPHGGWLERMARWAFAFLAIMLIGEPVQRLIVRGVPSDAVTSSERAFVLAKAAEVHHDFFAKSGGWTVEEAAMARGRLIRLRDRLARSDEPARDRVQRSIDAVVNASLTERQLAVEQAANMKDRQRAAGRLQMLHTAFVQPITSELTELQQVDQMGDQIRVTKDTPAGRSAFAGFLVFLAMLYALMMPFAFCVYFARMARRRLSVAEEVVLGWQNLVFSTVFWPFGMSEYPQSAARAMRRRVIAAEYLARMGVRWESDLTAADHRAIERLVEAPIMELRARLAEIQQIPTSALMQARFAAYTTVFVGMMLAPFSLARAQTRGTSTSVLAKPAAAEVVKPAVTLPVELNGFVQGEGGGPKVPFGIERAWLIATARPDEALMARLITNLVGPDGRPVLLGAFGRLDLGHGFSARIGQFAQAGAAVVPRPDGERLIGGPLAQTLVGFWEPGVEGAFQHGTVSASVAVVSGSGKDVPDANASKDVVASAALGPFGPLRFQFTTQAGREPDGLRTRNLAFAALTAGRLAIELLGTHQRLGDADSFAASGMAAWCVGEHFDTAIGYDELRLAGAPRDHVARAQVTVIGFHGHARAGPQYRWSASAGHQGLLRVQVDF